MSIPPIPASVLCQAVVESDRVIPCAIVRQDGDEVEVIPFSGETHSTTAFNGIAVITAKEGTIDLPETISSRDCARLLHAIARQIPPATARKVHFIPFG